MKYKKIMFMLITAIFLVSIAGVCAADANDTIVASDDANQMELSSNNEITEDNLKTSEENNTLTQANDAESDSQILSEGEGTYYDLRNEIGNGGDKNLTKSYYSYTGGDTIEIKNSGVINGNGAVIDMAQSGHRAFYVTASGVTIKNLTIKNANYNGDGGAIYFRNSGTVTNCNFTGNTAYGDGGAIWMYSGSVENCNFTNNTATYGGAVYFSSSGTVTNCNFTANTANEYGGAVYFDSDGNVTNCNFTANTANEDGGAVYLLITGTVTNCNFTDNKATGTDSWGGAVYFGTDSTVTNCNFTGNTATNYGGAVFFYNQGTVTNCNFTNNVAGEWGGAVIMGSGTVTNCIFVNNVAGEWGGAILSVQYLGVTADTCIFKTDSDTTFNTNNLQPTLNVDNFTTVYSSGDKLTFDLKTNSGKQVNNGNISISVYFKDNNSWVGNYSCLSGEGWIVDLPVGSYYAIFNTEYKLFTPVKKTITVIPNIPYYANVTPVTTNNRTVNITANSNIPQDIIEGKLLFILPNSTKISANYTDGIWWAVHTFDDYADYQVNASYVGLSNVIISNATISITRANSTVNVSDVVLNYGEAKNVTVTAEGATGITAKINDTNVTVVNNFTIPISGLAAGNYTLTVTTIADEDHNPVIKTVKITVNKAHTEILIVNETLDLKVGDETIVATLTPADAGNVTFTSSNVSVVDFDDEGNVIAQGKGQAIITVSFAGNNNYAAAENRTVTIDVNLNDASVTVDKDALDLKIYETYAINATKHPDTILLDIAYTSSNSSVATVDEKGIVTAVGVGSAVITVEVGDDEIYAKNSTTVKVTVSKVPTEIAADPIAATYNANKDLVITLKDSNGNPISGLNITVDFNGARNYTTDTNGQVKIPTMGLAANIYDVGISFNGTENYVNCSNTTTVSIYKESSRVDTKPLTTDYNVHKYLVVGLKDNEGNPIRNADASIEIHGVTYKCRSDDAGDARLIIRLNPGTYTAKITFDNVNYTGFTQYVTVIVKKLTPKLTAKKKTFKKSKKVKKYTVTLKANSKALAKVKLTLKVKGKTYKAKTNAKGKAIFKIKNLKKKGKYRATVKFAGNTYYNKVTKKVKITVK